MKIYIVEGIDGSGKSTAVKFIQDIHSRNKKVLVFKEPDGYFRQILSMAADPTSSKMSTLDEWMCFWLNRFDLWMHNILPFVDEDVIVIIDRSFVSTYAYQICGRELDSEFEKSFFFWKSKLLDIFADKEVVIQHIYMRVSVKTALNRVFMRPAKKGDLIQFEVEDFLKRTKSGFDIYYNDKLNLLPFESVVVINADKTLDEVNLEIREKLTSGAGEK